MKKRLIGLLMSVVLSVNAFAHPVQKIQFIAVAIDERNVFAVTNDQDDSERVDLPIVDKPRSRNVDLKAGKSKKFVVDVPEGHSLCIEIGTDISSKVSIAFEANGVTLKSSKNGTKNCSRPLKESGYVYLSITNTHSEQITFEASFSVSKTR
jgi:hypothetical protein